MFRILSLLVGLSALASDASARQASPPPQDAPPAGAATGAAPAALSFAGIAGPGVQVVLHAERKDKKGTVALDWGTGTTQMRLSLSGVLNASEETVPATLTGLSSGAEFRYGLTWFTSPGPNPEQTEKLKALCKQLIDEDNQEIEKRNSYLAAMGVKELAEPLMDPIDACDRSYVYARDAGKGALFDFYQQLDKPIWLRGLEVGVSQAKYAFLLPVSLGPDSENHANVLLAGRFGRYTVPTGFVIGAVTYTRNYEAAGQPQQICKKLENVEDQSATTCASGIIGQPNRVERVLASLEVRKFFSDYKAITPSVSYGRAQTNDGKSVEVWSVDVPVYFIEGPGGTLGGVRFGWRSDRNEVTAALFVGGAIGLLK